MLVHLPGRRLKALKPAIFIPTLYFVDGLPYSLVVYASVIFYKNLGESLIFIGQMTSLFYLPWVLKFAWAPMVDLVGTKRNWIVVAQVILAVICIGFALALNFPDCAIVTSIAPCVRSAIMAFQSAFPSHGPVVPLSSNLVVYFTLVCFSFMALVSATQDVAMDGYYLEVLDKGQQSYYVGVRSAIYKMAILFGSSVLIWIVGKLTSEQHMTMNQGWAVGFAICATICLIGSLVHYLGLPKSSRIPSADAAGDIPSLKTFITVFVTFFQQEKIGWIVLYILTFRLGDAFVLKMANPFLLDDVAKGGMGFKDEQLALIGGAGIVLLLLGGIIGGIVVSKYGLKRSLMPTAIFQNATILLYYLLAQFRPGLPIVAVFNAIEQFAYGLGTAAYMVFLLSTVKTQYKAGHYAVATAMMALGIMLPGYFSGNMAQALGYKTFFLVSFFAAIPGMITILLLPLEDK
jgi:MFS transporter, PAT family, beta-lactamase induction signal transducer AmpG